MEERAANRESFVKRHAKTRSDRDERGIRDRRLTYLKRTARFRRENGRITSGLLFLIDGPVPFGKLFDRNVVWWRGGLQRTIIVDPN